MKYVKPILRKSMFLLLYNKSGSLFLPSSVLYLWHTVLWLKVAGISNSTKMGLMLWRRNLSDCLLSIHTVALLTYIYLWILVWYKEPSFLAIPRGHQDSPIQHGQRGQGALPCGGPSQRHGWLGGWVVRLHHHQCHSDRRQRQSSQIPPEYVHRRLFVCFSTSLFVLRYSFSTVIKHRN